MRSTVAHADNISVQLGGIISANIYRADDKVSPPAAPRPRRPCSSRPLCTQPYYHRGNKTLLAIIVVNLVLFALTKVYFVLRNRHKRRVWESLSSEERQHYLQTTTDEGNRRLDFLFAH